MAWMATPAIVQKDILEVTVRMVSKNIPYIIIFNMAETVK